MLDNKEGMHLIIKCVTFFLQLLLLLVKSFAKHSKTENIFACRNQLTFQ